jgi:hypothetical protein
MEINVKKLAGHGFKVEAFDDDGHTLRALSHVTISRLPGCGGIPAGLLNDIRNMLMSREYGDLAVETLIRRVHSLQILESIEASDRVEE